MSKVLGTARDALHDPIEAGPHGDTFGPALVHCSLPSRERRPGPPVLTIVMPVQAQTRPVDIQAMFEILLSCAVMYSLAGASRPGVGWVWSFCQFNNQSRWP